MSDYIIEVWVRATRKYVPVWAGSSTYAISMFNKPYYRKYTRRLKKVKAVVVRRAKAAK